VQLCLYNLLVHLLLYPGLIGLGAPLVIPSYTTTSTPLQESTMLCVLRCAGPQPFGYTLRTCLAGPNVYSPSDNSTPHIIVCTTLHLSPSAPIYWMLFTHAHPHTFLPHHISHISLTHSPEESWDMSASLAHIFPKAEADWLENEQNYYVWSVQMKNVFETCKMWNIVNGSETIPSDDTTNATKHQIWIKKDNLAKAMITQCIKVDLVIKVAHTKHTKESWDIFLSKYSQTGSGSIMLWFRRLTKQLPSGGDISTYVTGFQEAIRYLANAEFNIPGYIAAAILLLTLPSNPGDPHSWNQHVAGVKIDKSTTTLLSVVYGILEEK
jgi:gag-polypeptide of LTR copia-type